MIVIALIAAARPVRALKNRSVARVRSQGTGRLRAWAARRPLTMFLTLLFAIAYPVMSLPVLADHGVIAGGWLPAVLGLDAERFASVLLIFAALLPSVLWVTWAADGADGLRALVRRMIHWRYGARWWFVVLLGLPTLTIAFAVALGDTFTPIEVSALVVGQILGLLVNLILVNWWEETAWTGFVQTRLERRHSLGVAAVITAVPFALIHLPLHFIGDFSVSSLATALVTLLIVAVLVRLLIGVVLRGTRDSILAAALVHTAFNRSNNDEGIVAALVQGQARGLAGLLAVIVLTAAVAMAARRRLSRTHRLTLDAQ